MPTPCCIRADAALLCAERTLLIADAHFGKAVSFRRLGVPVPRGTTTETLDELSRWRAQHHGVDLTLVRGNHDDRAGDPPADLAVTVVDEPLVLGPFALCHHPRPVAGSYVLAGHSHPCISVSGRAFERLRLPCFWFGDDSGALPRNAVGVLPAFGSFTGMHRIEPRAGDRIFPIAGEAVRAIPALPIA